MSRKNKYLRAFLHQTPNPTIEQAWDCAWKHAQKTFHARSMQDMEEQLEIERDYSKLLEGRVAALESTNLYQQLTTAQAENEALRARVAELEDMNAGLAAAADSLSMDVYDLERQSVEGGE